LLQKTLHDSIRRARERLALTTHDASADANINAPGSSSRRKRKKRATGSRQG
jgi:hypothetical protein